MPNFKTSGEISLQPNDNMGYSFTVTVGSSATANDGFIPYGTTVSSVVVIAYDKDDVNVTSELIFGTPSVSQNVVSMQLKYPTTSGDGRYKLTMILTLDNGDVKEADFDRVYARNK